MKKSCYSDEQIVWILREADTESIAEVAKRHGVSEASIQEGLSESYGRVAEQAATLPEMRWGYATDREGDIATLMKRADELRHPADWLFRSQPYEEAVASPKRRVGT